MKADDDTYMIVENLRSLLSAHSAADPLYFGLRFRKFVAQGYMAGGPGREEKSSLVCVVVVLALTFQDMC